MANLAEYPAIKPNLWLLPEVWSQPDIRISWPEVWPDSWPKALPEKYPFCAEAEKGKMTLISSHAYAPI